MNICMIMIQKHTDDIIGTYITIRCIFFSACPSADNLWAVPEVTGSVSWRGSIACGHVSATCRGRLIYSHDRLTPQGSVRFRGRRFARVNLNRFRVNNSYSGGN